jgi:predicted 3-demethylubiquinone-9 3-methyltransferase (glyoxalase superfamily)
MTHKIVPNLWFDDQAQQAAEFYTSIFPNSGSSGS